MDFGASREQSVDLDQVNLDLFGIGSNVAAGGREAKRWQVGLLEVQGGKSNPFLCRPSQVIYFFYWPTPGHMSTDQSSAQIVCFRCGVTTFLFPQLEK